MSEDDFDDDRLTSPPRPFRRNAKRVQIHRYSQRTVVEFDGPFGPIQIDSTSTITIEIAEDASPPRRFDGDFARPPQRRLSKPAKR
jgi:hypothetical protein